MTDTHAILAARHKHNMCRYNVLYFNLVNLCTSALLNDTVSIYDYITSNCTIISKLTGEGVEDATVAQFQMLSRYSPCTMENTRKP
jgi:hypothetical protein